MSRTRGWLYAWTVLLCAACQGDDGGEPDYANVMTFDSAVVRIETAADTHLVNVEVADTPERQSQGLMERTSLAEDAGMVFTYPAVQDASSGFWMFRTRIPLDIAFADSTGTIVTIHTMQPCASPNSSVCPGYLPGARYQSALEVNAGYFAKNGIKVGDRFVLVGTPQR